LKNSEHAFIANTLSCVLATVVAVVFVWALKLAFADDLISGKANSQQITQSEQSNVNSNEE
jgi:hypothetical protein